MVRLRNIFRVFLGVSIIEKSLFFILDEMSRNFSTLPILGEIDNEMSQKMSFDHELEPTFVFFRLESPHIYFQIHVCRGGIQIH